MAFVPRTNKFAYRVPVLDGGLNTKYTDSATPPNQTPDAQNVQYDDHGAVGTVYGYTQYNTTAVGTGPIDGLHSYYDNGGNQVLLAACAGSLHEATATTFTPLSGSTGLYTSGVDVDMITANDYAVINNAYNPPRKWDGDELTTLGISATTDAGAAADVGAGSLNGEYRWAITGVNTYNVESDYAIITDYLTVANREVTISGIPTFPASAGVTSKFLYRNTAAVSSVFWRVTSLAAAATSYTDTAADSELVTEAPSDNGTCPPVEFMVYYRGRLFGAGDPSYPMRLYWSEAGAPETWKSDSYMDINAGDGQPISGLAVFQNNLTIPKANSAGKGSIWMLFMPDTVDATDSSAWYLFKAPSAYTSESHKALTFFNDWVFLLSRDGGFAFTGSDLALSAADQDVGRFATDSHTFNIEPDIRSLTKTKFPRFPAITFDNKVWMAVETDSTLGRNNRIYVYDFVRASSTDRSMGAWGYIDPVYVQNFTVHEGDLLAGSSSPDGLIWKLDTGRNFNGDAIDSYFWTIPIAGNPEHRDYTKVWRKLRLLVSFEGNWNLTINYRPDWEQSDGKSTTISLNPGGSLWGTMIWGEDLWGGGNDKDWKTIILEPTVSKAIQLRFSTNTANQHWKVHEFELEYNLRSRR